MTGLLVVSPTGSGRGFGRYQSITNSNANSEAPTQVMYRPIGTDNPRRLRSATRANTVIPDVSYLNVVTFGIDGLLNPRPQVRPEAKLRRADFSQVRLQDVT